jgi:enamine deaminase RidA (YjgF/YER057c/UK114 family)
MAEDRPSSPEARLVALGIVLPPAPRPIAQFLPSRLVGGLLYVSGLGPLSADGVLSTGRVGDQVSTAEARRAARLTGLNILAVIRAALGSLDEVACMVKLLGMVNAVPGFEEHPQVIDGCSELFHEVFGDAGRHARSAVGMGSLPMNICVEIEAIVAVRS